MQLTSSKILQELYQVEPTRLPNTFLVGAMKSGTSWLSKQLDRHPDVFLPGIKEPNLLVLREDGAYDLNGPLDTEQLHARMHFHSAFTVPQYEEMYEPGAEQKTRVDASIRYLVSDRAADRIHALYDNFSIKPRILIMLRDPVDRAWSHWQMHRAMGIEPLGFSAALEAEDQRMADGWSYDWAYAGYSRYNEHLMLYIEQFGQENLHVEFYEDAVKKPDITMERVFGFLGLDPALAEAGQPSKRVRVKKPTGSSKLEQMSLYFRPHWRKRIPKPLRHAAWQALEKINGSVGVREIPKREAATLRCQMEAVMSQTEILLGRSAPWPRVYNK